MPGLIRRIRRPWDVLWPWLLLALVWVPALWHVVDFPEDGDPEFPQVVRPTFSRRPPPAYRLAEPGDTIDRVALYLAAGAVMLSLAGAWKGRGRGGLWPAALGLALGLFWYAATPGPTFDGWHGLGWRTILNPEAPLGLRLALVAAALGIGGLVGVSAWKAWPRRALLMERGWAEGVLSLSMAAALLVALRQVEIPGVEPVGYWPRWALVGGGLAFDLALVRALQATGPIGGLRRLVLGGAIASGWAVLIALGLWLTWYHRPLERLREVVPGKIYVCAMPTEQGLAIAHRRHHFKTIINLFPEDTPFRSPRLPEELRFARAHGIRYVGNPSDESASNDFLDLTLTLARDPNAWPILVHCHACQDRTPAWMGIYRFAVQGRPLAEIMQEIERHRGYRPKASVILLYNRVLPAFAPAHYASDPTAALLRRCARGTRDPYQAIVRPRGLCANRAAPPCVSEEFDTREGAGSSCVSH